MMRGKRLREMLDQTVDRIIQSYNRHGGINHIKGPSLPAQGEIIETLESLVSIISPDSSTQATSTRRTSDTTWGQSAPRYTSS